MQAALTFFPGVARRGQGRVRGGIERGQPAVGDTQSGPMLRPYEGEYRWLTDVYESVRPVDVAGRLAWHVLARRRSS